MRSGLVQAVELELTQARPEQQAVMVEHAWPTPGQLLCWQVPVVLPAGTLQFSPEQQSDVEVQTPLNG